LCRGQSSDTLMRPDVVVKIMICAIIPKRNFQNLGVDPSHSTQTHGTKSFQTILPHLLPISLKNPHKTGFPAVSRRAPSPPQPPSRRLLRNLLKHFSLLRFRKVYHQSRQFPRPDFPQKIEPVPVIQTFK